MKSQQLLHIQSCSLHITILTDQRTIFDVLKIERTSFSFLVLCILPSKMLVRNSLSQYDRWTSLSFSRALINFSTFTYIIQHFQIWLPLDPACLRYPPPNPHLDSFEIIFVSFTKSPNFTSVKNNTTDKFISKLDSYNSSLNLCFVEIFEQTQFPFKN